MAEQTQNEESGSVALPLAIGVGAGVGTKILYSKGANQFVADAIAGKEGVKEELVRAAKGVVQADSTLNTNQLAANFLKEEGRIANLTGATIEKMTGENAKGFKVNLIHPEGTASTLTVMNLDGEAAGLLKEGQQSVNVAGEELAKLTKGAEKSWVAKTAAKAEQEVIKAVRGNEAWSQAGGGIKSAIGHMSGGGKVMVGAAAVATVAGLGIGIKNMLSNPSHTNRIEADRAAPAQEPAR